MNNNGKEAPFFQHISDGDNFSVAGVVVNWHGVRAWTIGRQPLPSGERECEHVCRIDRRDNE